VIHRRPSVPAAVSSRLRAAGVLLVCLATALPLLVAAGDDPGPELLGADATSVSVVVAARAQVGDDYLWGGNGPDAWDCSGLTSVIWRTVGRVKDIPRTSAQQLQWAVPLPAEQLLPGDLVFFGAPVSHVGIYSSGGRIIDASSSRTGVVERPMWKAGVVRYGRVPRPGMAPVRPWTPPPAPSPSAAPSAAPAPASSRAPESLSASSRPTVVKVPAARASAKPVATRTPAAKPAAKVPAVQPLQGLPAVQKAPSSAVARKAVAGALSVVGSPHFSDARLVRDAWRHAGGGTLAHHVALYRGHGYMVAASASYGKVVVRRVFQAPLVRLFRLPG
jgi:hypothetical protein